MSEQHSKVWQIADNSKYLGRGETLTAVFYIQDMQYSKFMELGAFTPQLRTAQTPTCILAHKAISHPFPEV